MNTNTTSKEMETKTAQARQEITNQEVGACELSADVNLINPDADSMESRG